MRVSNELDRLSAAEPALLADTEPIVGAAEEERILERILASSRHRVTGHGRTTRRRRVAYLLAGAAVVAAAVSLGVVGRGAPSATQPGRHRLDARTIALAGYRFRLPVGYARSPATCAPVSFTPGKPMTAIYAVRAAASADGGCLDVALTAGRPPVPPDAATVAVGPFTGFLAAEGSEQATLDLKIPVSGSDHWLVLSARGLTSDQLLAVARSGLPA